MRVRCTDCGALYELDDQRIPETGLAVKCSRCEHIFVAKKGKRPTTGGKQASALRPAQPVTTSLAAPPSPNPLLRDSALPFSNPSIPMPPAQEEPSPYFSLRRPDGKVYSFRDMATLQRWIVERKALRVDELSQDGFTWIPLGAIPELGSFFDVVDRSSGVFQAPRMDAMQEPEQVPAPRMTMQMVAQPANPQGSVPVSPTATVEMLPIEEPPAAAASPAPAVAVPPSKAVLPATPMVTPKEIAGQVLEAFVPTPAPQADPQAEAVAAQAVVEETETQQVAPEPEPVPEEVSPADEPTPATESESESSQDPVSADAESAAIIAGGDSSFFANETPVQAKTPTVIVNLNQSIAHEARERTSGLYASQEQEEEEKETSSQVADAPPSSSDEGEPTGGEPSAPEPVSAEETTQIVNEPDQPDTETEPPSEPVSSPVPSPDPAQSLDAEWAAARRESEWDDLEEEPSGGGKGKLVAVSVAVLGILAALWVFVVQDMIFPKGPSPKTLEEFNEAKVQAFFFSMESLLDAENTLVPILGKEKDFAQGYALLSIIQVSRSDLLKREMETLQADIQDLTTQIEAAGKDPEAMAPLIERKKGLIQEFGGLEKDFNKYSGTAYGFAEQAFKLEPENVWAHLALADYYRQGDDPVKAKEHLDRAEALPEATLEAALIAYLKGTLYAVDQALYKDAHRSFDVAFKKDPTLIRAQWSKALLFLKQEMPDKALTTLEEILQLHPGHRPSKELAEKLRPKEEPVPEPTPEPQAKKAPAPSANREPAAPASDYQRLMNQANRERRSFNTTKALELFEQAKALNETAAVWTGIGLCHLDMSKFGDAAAALEKAVSMGRTPDAVMNLAISYEGLGKPDKALKYYKIFVESWPNARNADEARASVARLQP